MTVAAAISWFLTLALLAGAVLGLLRARRWAAGRPARVAWLRGLLRLPRSYFVDLHHIVARDTYAAHMHVAAAGGFVGAVLLVLLTAYIGLSYWRDRRDAKALREHAEEVEEIGGRPLTLTRSLLLVAVGLVLLALGADLLVEGAVDIARHFGVSETVIGLTLVAFGTSLPELATCAIAAFHRHADVALGNILGSNMFNILGIMGVVTIVTPVPVPAQIMDFDVWFMFGISVLVLPLMITRGRLNRLESGGLVALYLAYLWAQFHGVQGLFDLIPA